MKGENKLCILVVVKDYTHHKILSIKLVNALSVSFENCKKMERSNGGVHFVVDFIGV